MCQKCKKALLNLKKESQCVFQKSSKKIQSNIFDFFSNFQGPPKLKVTFRSIIQQRRATQKRCCVLPCPLTSLSIRKSWEIFEFSSEKIDFLIFVYLVVILKKFFSKWVRSDLVQNFFFSVQKKPNTAFSTTAIYMFWVQ